MQDTTNELLALALRHARGRRTETPIPRVGIFVADEPTGVTPGVYQPALCLVLQGAKEVTIGDRSLRYDPAGYFIASVDLPVSGRIVEASRERPYVCVILALPREGLAALLAEVPLSTPAPPEAQEAFAVSPVTRALTDPWLRLMRLLDTPQDIPVLAPMLEREILYRLLTGPQGPALRQLACADSRLARVRRAIDWIRAHYDQPLRIEALADLAAMSAASFHRHFKAATAMSPLQFQKSLRLQHARQLLLSAGDVARVGYAVGYESASQFSREYARLFGVPPGRDAARLRADAGALAEVASAA